MVNQFIEQSLETALHPSTPKLAALPAPTPTPAKKPEASWRRFFGQQVLETMIKHPLQIAIAAAITSMTSFFGESLGWFHSLPLVGFAHASVALALYAIQHSKAK